MAPRGFGGPLYILPFDHRGSFKSGMFGWHGVLTSVQIEEVAQAKRVIQERFLHAVASGIDKDSSGILVDEQFGAAILQDSRSTRLSNIGFAVGRTDFWNPLLDWRDGKASTQMTVDAVAHRFESFIALFEGARADRERRSAVPPRS
jgi:myo-inositol catabolism protein IolC